MNLRFVANLALFSGLASGLACSAGGDASSKTATPNTTNSNGGTQPILNTNGGGPVLNTGGSGALPMDPNDPRNVPVRPELCDATGKCTCLRLGLVGSLDSSANAKDTKPFIDWLNNNSDGTATVSMVPTKPAAFDAAFLANYDILVVANVNGWSFTADEKAAVAKWVSVDGGGLVTLTGFVSTAAEPPATSQLVEFAGMGYSGTGMTEWTAPAAGATTPIYYKGGTADLRNCLNLWSVATDKEASQTTAIKFMPQTGPLEKLTASLDYVGAYIGWPVNAPAGSTVLATDPMTGKNMAVALEVQVDGQGRGRILSFGDEWIVFTNQWQPTGTFTDMRMDASNPCWQGPVDTTPSFFQSVKSLYQTKQFWYNIINWVAPPSQCNFTIEDPDVVVK